MARPSSARAPEVKIWETGTLEEHVSLIQQQMHKGVQDSELRQLTLKVLGARPDDWAEDPRTGETYPIAVAYGQQFILPKVPACAMKDDRCESQAIWDFTVLNVRYVLDPAGYDLFATPKYTLLAGGGDCDDMVILMGAMHRLAGFDHVAARIVSTNGRYWEHVYLLVGYPKTGQPRTWVALDPTVKGAVPGWQYDRIKTHQDFLL